MPAISCRQCHRSASRGSRETDIRIDTTEGVLLVENKIDARFQMDQQRSYELEVERLRESGTPAWAVVVYPVRRQPEMVISADEAFDALVPIEDLIDKVTWSSDALSAVSLAVLRRTLQPKLAPETDPRRSAWGEGYRVLVAELAKGAGLMIGGGALRTGASSFVQFLGQGVSERGWISHHIEEGEAEAGLYRRRPDPATIPAIARVRSRSAIRAAVPVMTFDRCHTNSISADLCAAGVNAEQGAVATGTEGDLSDHWCETGEFCAAHICSGAYGTFDPEESNV